MAFSVPLPSRSKSLSCLGRFAPNLHSNVKLLAATMGSSVTVVARANEKQDLGSAASFDECYFYIGERKRSSMIGGGSLTISAAPDAAS
jgi:hypothetical protein